MKRGIVIGKFMPVHKGHIALIEFAASNCDELVVAVDPGENGGAIPLGLRYRWMKEIFKGRKNIRIASIRKALPQDKEPSRTASRIWAGYLTKRFGKFDLVFSSEIYGDFLAEYMLAKSMVFDLERKRVPVSGTKIRERPLKYWEYIPEIVRPYFVKRVCFYGPESCGKTTMAKYLAGYYRTNYIPEYAREYSEKRGNRFTFDDMERFARGQKRIEARALEKSNRVLFCDTDAIATKIYSQYYFGRVSEMVDRFALEEKFDFYLVMDIDIPWVADPLRDAPHLRTEHRELFLQELEQKRIPYAVISGDGEARKGNAVRATDEFLENFS